MNTEILNTLVVRFQHSHPVSARSVANVGIIRTTSKYRFLVEFMDLTFATSLPLTPDANVKSTPLGRINPNHTRRPPPLGGGGARFGARRPIGGARGLGDFAGFKNILCKAVALSAAILALTSGSAFAQAAGQSFTIQIDGSSTVFPISEALAEGFQAQTQGRVRVTVGESGTGGGFRKFCRGEIHISDASRPIRASEMAACAAAGIQYVEIPVAFDGLTVVVNPSSPIRSMTVAELRRLWAPAAQGRINNFNQINPRFPNQAITLFGPGSASGTFDYFTEAVNGTARASRTDYTPSEDDNVIVQGVASNAGGLGYFGLAYYEENRSRLRALSIDNGAGPVAPSAASVLDGTYAPLSRPLFIYVNAAALRRPQVNQFVQYYLNNAATSSQRVGYVPLPANAYAAYLQRTQRRQVGTAFGGRQAIGLTVAQLLQRRLALTPTSQ